MGVELSTALTRMRADLGMPVEVINAPYIDRPAFAMDRPDGSVWAVTNFGGYPPHPSSETCMASIISDRLVEKRGYVSDSVTAEIDVLSDIEVQHITIAIAGTQQPSAEDIKEATEKAKQIAIDSMIVPKLRLAMISCNSIMQSILGESVIAGSYSVDVPGVFQLGTGRGNPAALKLKFKDGSIVSMEDALKRAEDATARTTILLEVSTYFLNYMESFMFEPEKTRKRSLDSMGPLTRDAFMEMLDLSYLGFEGDIFTRDELLRPDFLGKFPVYRFNEATSNLRLFFGSETLFHPVIVSHEKHDKRIVMQALGVLLEKPSAESLPNYMKALDLLVEVRTVDVSLNIEAVLDGCRASIRSTRPDISEADMIHALVSAARQGQALRALVYLDMRYPGAHDSYIKKNAGDMIKQIEQSGDLTSASNDKKLAAAGDLLCAINMLLGADSVRVSLEIKEAAMMCVSAIRSVVKGKKYAGNAIITNRMVYQCIAEICDEYKFTRAARYFRQQAGRMI